MSILRKSIFITALLVFILSSGKLIQYYGEGLLAEKAFDDLSSKINDTKADLKTKKGTVMGKYVRLYKKNKDMIGWLIIDDSKIDYPVMQTAGKKQAPQYYLRKDFEKNYKISGTPFMDADSSVYKPTDNWIIYGHNMNNGSMFANILRYDDKKFFQKHRYIYFDTIYKIGVYEVFAASKTQIYSSDSDVFQYYRYPAIDNKEDYDMYVRKVKEMSSVKVKTTPKYSQQLLTLSTCSYHLSDRDRGRYFVVAREINAKKYYLKKLQKILNAAQSWTDVKLSWLK